VAKAGETLIEFEDQVAEIVRLHLELGHAAGKPAGAEGPAEI